MDIPLLSPLARIQSFGFSSTVSHTGTITETSPRLFHYAEDDEDVVDNNSRQYYPLMDYSERATFRITSSRGKGRQRDIMDIVRDTSLLDLRTGI